MTVDDALRAMAVIDGQRDGGHSREAIVEMLHAHLLKSPEDFWERYFEVMDAVVPNQMRDLARELIMTGELTSDSSIADLDVVLTRRFGQKEQTDHASR